MRIMKVFAFVTIVVAAIGAYFYSQRKKSKFEFTSDILDAELSFDEVMAFFKSKNLNKDVHTPFIANGDSAELKEMIHQPYPEKKEGYVSLLLGVYNKDTDEIEDAKLIYAKSIDAKISDILGCETMIVLS